MLRRFLLLSLITYPTFSDSASYKVNVEPLVQTKCASCHKGPYLDLRTFPFFSDIFLTQEDIVKEMIRRTKLTDLKRMPPVNFPGLLPEEIALLESWLAEGLKE